MRWLLVVSICVLAAAQVGGGIPEDDEIIRRGDANHSGAVNITDAIFINNYLYSGGPAPPCINEADANHDGRLDGSDAAYLLNWLYNGGPAPPTPGPYATTCSVAPAPTISCTVGC